MNSRQVLQLTPEIDVTHMGPPLEKGRLPALFYFGLSARESLELDPYNQPVALLYKSDIRIFSIDLPAHGEGQSAIDALTIWANAFKEGEDPLTPFLDKVLFAIKELQSRGLIIPEKVGLMGLSRGGLIACHVAARLSQVRAVVCFAPMTSLTASKEFAGLEGNASVDNFDLLNMQDHLFDKAIRFYIGNRDIKVGTGGCFHFVESLANTAFEQGVRSPPIEMIISPSIGHMGHGTGKAEFEAGGTWISEKLGIHQ
ncbi:MAG: hypothetical protein KR126chlam1_00207 [Chlamydiae bacterium]|nr:hypothetical protein [Chlamydiota bacterium]